MNSRESSHTSLVTFLTATCASTSAWSVGYGILWIAMVGQGLLEVARRCVPWNSESDDLKKEASDCFSSAASLARFIYGLGSAGAFFGRLIKSAVARQREF